MVSTPLNIMKYAYKRKISLERKRVIKENTVAYPDLNNVKNKDIYRYRTETFLKECVSYKDALSLMETMYMDNQFDILEETVNSTIINIIPTVESSELPNCIAAINNSVIGDINRDRLIEAANNYKSIDRILKNHKTLSKRFRIDSLKGKSEKDRMHTVCEMVCTYGRSNYINFNIALEEAAYLESINDFRTGPMCEDRMVKYITDYFLEFDNNSAQDIKNYRKAIIESKILSNNAACLVPYLMNGPIMNGTWFDKLNEWKVNPNKSMQSIIELARENYSDVGAFDDIINTAKDFAKINEMDFDIKTVFEDFKDPMNAKQAHNIIGIIGESNIKNSDDLVCNLRSLWEAEVNDSSYSDGNTIPMSFTSDDIDKFKMHNLITDAQDAGEFIDHSIEVGSKETPIKIEKIVSDGDISDVNESTILNYVDESDYISIKLRSYSYNGNPDVLHRLVESTSKCANNILSNRNSAVYYNIQEGYFDFCLRSKYKVILSESQENAKDITRDNKRNICNVYRILEAAESLNDSPIDEVVNSLRFDRDLAANISIEEAQLIFDIMNPILDKDSGVLKEFVYNCYTEGNIYYDMIKEAYDSLPSNTEFSMSLVESAADRVNLCARVIELHEGIVKNAANTAVGNVKKAVGIKPKTNKAFRKLNDKDSSDYYEDKSSDKKTKKNDKDDKKSDDKSSSKKDDDKEDVKDKNDTSNKDSDDSGENDKAYGKAVKTLNDAKLALKGLGAKGKDLHSKEQEMSRDLDIEFNHLLKTVKMLYTTDHREEIITGEVNHSISKIIKIGIGLAGAGLAAHTVVVPAIGAITLFALSKHASHKEKKMILDEIDIELQVLDREISRAESSGSTKKYRQLLTIQKNLQRKRQEIYYGIAKSGHRIPMQSTVGLRDRE